MDHSAPAATEVPALDPAVGEALARPGPGSERTVAAAGYEWAAAAWGEAGHPAVLLVHGVTSDHTVWWRVGPAIAAAGFRVTAVDLPGHGGTGGWRGRHRFPETAADLAEFIRAAGLDVPDLGVVGHSWGGMVVANLPLAGIRPRVLVLLDPPWQARAELELMTHDPMERRYMAMGEARATVRAANPTWTEGDVEAKAHGLTRFDEEAVRAVLLDNGDWDAGLSALADPAADGVDAWLIRGEEASGCLVPDARLPMLRARLGADRVLTIAGAPHSPQRTHPEATVAALLHALGRRHG